MPLSKQGPVFSLQSVYVKAPSDAAGTWVQIPSVTQAQYKGQVSEVELTGDNVYQGVLRHTQKGTITVKASQLAMAAIDKVTGNGSASVNTANGSTEYLTFGTASELNPPLLAVKAVMPVNRTNGTTGSVTAYWYSTQVSWAFTDFPGASYGAVSDIVLTFECFRSNDDENNVPLTTPAFGRIEFNS